MGQYYIAIILADNDSKKAEIIKDYLESIGPKKETFFRNHPGSPTHKCMKHWPPR